MGQAATQAGKELEQRPDQGQCKTILKCDEGDWKEGSNALEYFCETFP